MRTEAESRVEERTAAELQSQVETVFNKDVMIDVQLVAPGITATRELLPVGVHQVLIACVVTYRSSSRC